MFSTFLLVTAGLVVASIRLSRAEAEAVDLAGRTLAKTFGAEVVVAGAVEVRLFPRPQIILTNVSLHDSSGDAHVDIPTLKGTLTLASLMSGQIGFSRVQLIDATGWIDADRIGQPRAAADWHELGWALPGKIVVSSGVIAIRSSIPALSGIVSDLNAVFDGLDANGAATANGRGSWHGQHAEFSARLDPFFDFFAGRLTTASLKLHAPVFSASISGLLQRGVHGGFDGAVSGSTPSLSAMLRLGDVPTGFGQVVEHASFGGSGVETEDGIAFSDTRLVLNDTELEGSLAWQHNHGRDAFTGTFATDLLDLTPLLSALPDSHNKDGSWSDSILPLDASLWHDFDLRISANDAKVGRIEAKDAAFAALCRDGRIEVSLGEARSFDGLIKGRAVASVVDKNLDVKLDVSVARMSVGQLSSALLESDATGLASGHFTGEGHGNSVHALVQGLDGHGQVSIRQGKLPGLSMMADLLFPDADGTAAIGSRRESLPFDLAITDFRIAQGIVSINDGSFVGPDAHVAFKGQASLVNRGFSLSSVAVAPEDAPATDPGTPTNVVGTWGKPFHVIKLDKTTGDKWHPFLQTPEFFP